MTTARLKNPLSTTSSSHNNGQWMGFASSVTGASHIRRSVPNQDCAKTLRTSYGTIGAVADGHSFAACCRAEIGSKLAVTATIEACHSLLNISKRRKFIDEDAKQVTESILIKWRRSVRADIRKNPFSDAESSLIEGFSQLVAYGTTLAVSVVNSRSCLCIRLGDGQVFAATRDGVTGQILCPSNSKDESTNSMCQPMAMDLFAIEILDFNEFQPAIVVCATDGYDKSFRLDADFLELGAQLVKGLKEAGPCAVAAALSQELRIASDEGSNDDVSCSVLYRSDWFPKHKAKHRRRPAT